MNSRDLILSRVQKAQPELSALPDTYEPPQQSINVLEHFTQVLQSIGGYVEVVNDLNEIIQHLKSCFPNVRIITTLKNTPFEQVAANCDPHMLENVTLAVIESSLGVAENGALWITEHDCAVRSLPFIAENLAVIIHANAIVRTMHQAYTNIDEQVYGFGVFIAGPSKTADIEQSLVLGAHGSRSMRVFILQ